MNEILNKLQSVLEQRKNENSASSYVASLYDKGLDSILKKIGEESAETIMAAKDGVPEKIIYESADLLFHLMILLSHQNLDINQVLQELEGRFGLSGIAEKESRPK